MSDESEAVQLACAALKVAYPETDDHHELARAVLSQHEKIERLKADREACYVAAEQPAWGGPLDEKARDALRKVFPDAASIVRKAMTELRFAHDENARLRAALDYTTTQLIGAADFGGTSTDDYNIRTTARDLRKRFDLRGNEWESKRKDFGL